MRLREADITEWAPEKSLIITYTVTWRWYNGIMERRPKPKKDEQKTDETTEKKSPHNGAEVNVPEVESTVKELREIIGADISNVGNNLELKVLPFYRLSFTIFNSFCQ